MGTPWQLTVAGRTLHNDYDGHPSSALEAIQELFEGVKPKDLKAYLFDLTEEDFTLVGPGGSNAHFAYEYNHKTRNVKVEDAFSHPRKVLFEGNLKAAIEWANKEA